MTYYNLLTLVYKENCKNFQQTCKKKLMPYRDVMGRTNNVISTRTLYETAEMKRSTITYLLETSWRTIEVSRKLYLFYEEVMGIGIPVQGIKSKIAFASKICMQ